MNVTITVAEIGRANARTTSIKDTTGKYWYVWNDKLPQFQPGKSFVITETTSYTSPQTGRTSLTIKSFQEAAAGPVKANGAGGPVQPAPAYDDSARQMQIYVCGLMNSTASNSNEKPTEWTMMDVIDLTHKFKGAWLAVFGPSPLPRKAKADPISSGPQQTEDDMDDEIPF